MINKYDVLKKFSYYSDHGNDFADISEWFIKTEKDENEFYACLSGMVEDGLVRKFNPGNADRPEDYEYDITGRGQDALREYIENKKKLDDSRRFGIIAMVIAGMGALFGVLAFFLK